MFSDLVDYFAPPRCAVCREVLTGSEGVAHVFCNSCAPRLDPACDRWPCTLDPLLGIRPCPCCAELTAAPVGASCAVCAARPLGVNCFVSAAHYDAGLDNALRLLKYGGQWQLIPYFASLLLAAIGREPLTSHLRGALASPLVVPVPSHPHRIRERGFYLMGLLARQVARQLGLRLSLAALRCTQLRPPQASLSSTERAANAAGAFVARRSRCGLTILLLDDAVTTGSTISAASAALRSAGVSEIFAVSISRSLHFQRNRVFSVDNDVAGDGRSARSGAGGRASV